MCTAEVAVGAELWEQTRDEARKNTPAVSR